MYFNEPVLAVTSWLIRITLSFCGVWVGGLYVNLAKNETTAKVSFSKGLMRPEQ
jgi:hypothetical protein